MLNYDKNEKIFYKFIESCRDEVSNLSFDNIEIMNGNVIRKELVNKEQINKYTTVSDAIKIHRNNMIDVKLNHTLRIVSDVSKIAQKLNLNADFEQILKLSALLHDIARFPQAVNSNNFLDKDCKIFNGLSHAEYGYKMLYINNKFTNFDIAKNYRFAIANAVRYHQIPTLTGDLSLKFSNVNQLDVNKLTGNEILNENEKIIIATLVQIVKDVDMLDILYQHITGEFPVIKPSVSVKIKDKNINEQCKNFCISKEDILLYNNLNEQDLNKINSINIPVCYLNLNKLEVPRDIKDKFFNNDYIDLKQIQNREDYNFIVGMWWRLSHFLNNINLVANLEILKENKLLERIYNMYPAEYKFLVKDAFEYAEEQLLNRKIEENKGKVYVYK